MGKASLLLPAIYFVGGNEKYIMGLCPFYMQVADDGGQELAAEPTKGRCLRRTVSVPSEGQFSDIPPEGATKLGKSQRIKISNAALGIPVLHSRNGSLSERTVITLCLS